MEAKWKNLVLWSNDIMDDGKTFPLRLAHYSCNGLGFYVRSVFAPLTTLPFWCINSRRFTQNTQHNSSSPSNFTTHQTLFYPFFGARDMSENKSIVEDLSTHLNS